MHEAGSLRCSDAARQRHDPLLATAPSAPRLLLLEVPGPWGRAGLTATRLPAEVTELVQRAADGAGVRVQLIRRAGGQRHQPRPERPATDAGYAWALADPDQELVTWGRWHDAADLLDLDLLAPDPLEDRKLDPGGAGPQRLLLVCTHARRDTCCAVRGGPVAAALAATGDRQVWHTTHLAGDRFAANVLLLPEGELFGGLDEVSAPQVVRRLEGGRLTLEHYRGRVGRSPVEQAALHLAAARLGDDRRGAVRVIGEPVPDGADWQVLVERAGPDHLGPDRAGPGGYRRYRLRLTQWWAPAQRLSCSAALAKPALRFRLTSISEDQGTASPSEQADQGGDHVRGADRPDDRLR